MNKLSLIYVGIIATLIVIIMLSGISHPSNQNDNEAEFNKAQPIEEVEKDTYNDIEYADEKDEDISSEPVEGPIGSEEPIIANVENNDEETEEQWDEDDLMCAAKLTDRAELQLRRTGYICSYNKDMLLPNWVGWVLTADHTDGPYKRNGVQFQEDFDVPEPRVNTYDYSGSGFDRGHMCPSGDCKWSEEAQKESFLMTNICPQDHNMNCGDWNELEIACRNWARHYGKLFIVCGPILFRQQHKTIGKHKVIVPEAYFKVILRLGEEPKAIGFVYRNDTGNKKMNTYVNTVDQVERITGMDFFPNLPQPLQDEVESVADLDDWKTSRKIR